MLLAIDIGNTNVVIGLFRDDKLFKVWRLRTHLERTLDEWLVFLENLLTNLGLKTADIDNIAIASVVPALTSSFKLLSEQHLEKDCLIIDHTIDFGITIHYDNPKSVGADRICNAIAGYGMFGGPLVIVDFGTATTFDVVSGKGDYLGGILAPGLETAAHHLYERAAKLPSVELKFPSKMIATNTAESMQAGIMFGAVIQMEGIIRRIESELGESVKVISTGGLGGIIKEQSKMIRSYEHDLTLLGIKAIFEKQKGKSTI